MKYTMERIVLEAVRMAATVSCSEPLVGERGDLKSPCAAARLAALTIHLAVPKEPFGLTHFLRFFDRCGKCEPAFSATGSAGTLFSRHVIRCRSGVQVPIDRKNQIEAQRSGFDLERRSDGVNER